MCQVQSIRQKDALNAQKTGMSKTVCFSFKPMQRSNEPSYVCFLNIYYFLISGSEARQVSDKRIAEIFNASSPSETRPESGCSYRLFQMQQTHKFDPLRTRLTVGIYETLILAASMDLRAGKT